jgi:hypothetical protein
MRGAAGAARALPLLPPRWLLPGVALILLAACGSSRPAPVDRSAVLLSEAPPARAACTVLETPATLPQPAALVDTARLATSIGELRASRTDTLSGFVLLSLQYDPTGQNVRRQVIEHTVPPTVADSVQRLVFAALRQLPERSDSLHMRLRVNLGEAVHLQTGRSEYCPPWPRDPRLESALYGAQATGLRYRSGTRERVVLVRAWVEPAGYISGGRFVRGAPPSQTLEQDVIRYLRQFSFHPARIDGIPVGGFIDIPVRIPA